jgi:hypothetical protein
LVQITPSQGGDKPSTATQHPVSKLPQQKKLLVRERGIAVQLPLGIDINDAHLLQLLQDVA